MKNLLITVTAVTLLSIVAMPANAPTEGASYEALKSCFGRPPLVSVAQSMIYCSQSGTIYQDSNDLDSRGLLKIQLLSSTFGEIIPLATVKMSPNCA